MRRGLLILASAGGLAAIVGCSTHDIEDLCDRACACAGCTAAERQACVDESDLVLNNSVAGGCADAAEEFVDCFVDDAVCEQGELRASRLDGCRQERESYWSCESGCVEVGGRPSQLRYCLTH